MLITGLMLFGLVGCSSLGKPKDNDLYSVIKRFHHDLRWKYNEDAAARVLPKYATEFRDQLEDLSDDLNVTAWDLRKAELDPGALRASVRIQLSYFQMPSTVLKNEKIDQVWQQVEDQWYLIEWKGGPLKVPPESLPESKPIETDAPLPPAVLPEPKPVRDLPDDDEGE